jgi:HlyD family secretion protein
MSQAVESRASPQSAVTRVAAEQLDCLVQVTTYHGWVYVVTLSIVGIATIVFAFLYHVPTKVSGEGILLIENDTLVQVRATATGRLLTLAVKLGDQVAPGDRIGEVAQNDLQDAIREAEAKLDDVEGEDLELTRFERNERETETEAINRVQRAIEQTLVTAHDKAKIAERLVASDDRLRAQRYMNDSDVLESREKLYLIRDDLNKGQSRLAELKLQRLTGDISRRRRQLERGLKIGQLRTKLTLDREKFARTSRIVSQVHGRVAQVLSARGELVHEGAPVVLLHAPKLNVGTAQDGAPYESIVFVPAGEGKKIDLGDPVELSPATVKREEHGFIRGHVAAIWEMPATKLAMEAALEHPELADAFLKRYAPDVLLRVHVKLMARGDLLTAAVGKSSADRANRYRWSSFSGHFQPLKTGTLCQAAIVVERRKLISLIVPWAKTIVGSD